MSTISKYTHHPLETIVGEVIKQGPEEAIGLDRTDLDSNGLDANSAAGSSSVQAVRRATSLLLCFGSEHPEWTLSQLVKQTGVLRRTASRLLRTLESDGLVTFSRSSRRYSLGPALFQLAYVWISQASLARVAEPHLVRLAEATGETASLCIWNAGAPLCVAHADTPRPFRFLMGVGQTFSDVANAHSKVLLAFGPENRRSRSLSGGLQPLTPFTITDMDRFTDELKRIEDEGVAFDLQEQQLGVCGIAVPVWDFTNEVRGSLSLVVPETTYSPVEAKRHVLALKQTASALSYDLGYRGGSEPLVEAVKGITI